MKDSLLFQLFEFKVCAVQGAERWPQNIKNISSYFSVATGGVA